MSYKIGGAQNHSAPFDLNLDLLEVFWWKTIPLIGRILDLFPQFCSLLAPFCSLLGVTKAPPGPFLRCAYDHMIWLKQIWMKPYVCVCHSIVSMQAKRKEEWLHDNNTTIICINWTKGFKKQILLLAIYFFSYGPWILLFILKSFFL